MENCVITVEDLEQRVFDLFHGNIIIYKDSFIDTKHKIKFHCNIHNLDFWSYYKNIRTEHIFICPECKKESNIKNKPIMNNNIGHKCNICGAIYKGECCENDFCKKITKKQLLSLKKFGFDITKIGTSEVEKEFNRIRNILYDMYWTNHMSSLQICDFFNLNRTLRITSLYFNFLNIPIKSFSEATLESIKMGRTIMPELKSSNFKSGYHTTWDGNSVYLRSSYEEDYANELDNLKIHYEVETLKIEYFDTQKNEMRIAIPDFYIPDTNTIVEIKSLFTLNLQNMLDKKKTYIENGFKFKIIIEHVETDIDTLNVDDYKDNLIMLKRNKTHIGKSKWKWMNNEEKQLKIKEEDIQTYIDMGWKFGTIVRFKWMNNGSEQKQVFLKDVQSYLDMGWSFGILYRIQTRWINNGSETKMISIDKLQKYLNAGWKIGSLSAGKENIGKKWINNGTKAIRVEESELQKYLNNGWVLGKKIN